VVEIMGQAPTLFRDYQAAGINPANLGILENNVATLTFGLV
jgi:hypothetical protein